jgi:bifunctional enzyme CysN/CysC
MNEEAMETGRQYLMMHTTKTTPVFVDKLIYKMNVDTLGREDAENLQLNEIGRAKFTTAQPLFIDAYQVNQKTGSFIIIDPASNVTVGAGMIRSSSTESNGRGEEAQGATKNSTLKTQQSPNVVWEPWNIPREEREKRNGHKAKVLWLTGISGAGKSTIAKALERKLWEAGKQTVLLDGDQVRHGLNGDLGFSPHDRKENIRRVGEVARLFFEHGNIVLCTFVSPYQKDRDRARSLVPDDRFLEVHVTCSPETAQERDPKGLYEKAKKGEIEGLTGFDGTYEAPINAEIVANTDEKSVEEIVDMVISKL